MASGNFEDYSISASPGVNPTATKLKGKYQIEIESLRPSEFVTISFLINMEKDESPEVFVRSKSAVANIREDNRNFLYSNNFIMLPLIAIFSALFASYIMIRTRDTIPFSGGLDLHSTDSARDISVYILYRVNFHEMIEEIRNMDDLSFRYIVDKLLLSGKDANTEIKKQSIAALKSMLLLGACENSTKDVAVRAINLLGGSINSSDHKELRKPDDLRDEIDRVIAEELG